MSSEVAASAKKVQSSKVNSSSNNNNDVADDDGDDQLPKHWTKVASKKHPGKFYYFNVTTKESLWEHPGKTKALEKEKDIIRNVVAAGKSPSKGKTAAGKTEKVTQLKNDTQFKRKNLAKDRLDKLQKQLEVERKVEGEKAKCTKDAKTPESPRKRAVAAAKAPVKVVESPATKPKRKRAGSDESPSKKSKPGEVSSKSKAIAKKTPPKVTAKKLGKEVKKEVAKPSEGKKQPELSKAVKPSPKTGNDLKPFKIPKKAKQEPVTSSIFVDIQKLNDSKASDLPSPKTDLSPEVPGPTDAKLVLAPTPQVSYAQTLLGAIERPLPQASLTQIPHKPVSNQTTEVPAISTPKISHPSKLLKAIERPQPSPPPLVPPREAPTLTSTPKVQALIRSDLTTPGSVKSPANERLAGIREKLAQEVAQQTVLLDEDAEMTDLSDAQQNQNDHSITADAAEPEAMDWEDIPEDVALRGVVAVRQQLPNGFITGSGNSVLDATIPEYGVHLFDQIHFARFVFLVMDTNVFLSHLKGVERLLEKGFPHIGQPILVVPYIVLQELDRIKHREQGQPLAQAASQSIRFLNEHLKRRDPRVKGQSTVEATVHLVPVENPDDHIVNCCFQVRQIIAGRVGTDLMLLSNDVNLRNKALVNGVSAFGFGELMAEADRIRFASDDLPDGGSR